MSGIFETTALAVSGIQPDSAAGRAASTRDTILEMTQTAENAVLSPEDPGAWSADLRAAMAARIARLNGETALAERYAARSGSEATLSDPAENGTAQGLGAVLTFMDMVATHPRDATAADISALQAAGIGDADIVRLAELNAFLAYQVRLVAGLRALGGQA